jgi:Cytochrome C oxidase subunit II, transmembrane domain
MNMYIEPGLQKFMPKVYCDAAEPWQLGFQDAATPMMQGIIDLHHDIFFCAPMRLYPAPEQPLYAMLSHHCVQTPLPYDSRKRVVRSVGESGLNRGGSDDKVPLVKPSRVKIMNLNYSLIVSYSTVTRHLLMGHIDHSGNTERVCRFETMGLETPNLGGWGQEPKEGRIPDIWGIRRNYDMKT